MSNEYPELGKGQIADTLARAGIRIGKTTVGRILSVRTLCDKAFLACGCALNEDSVS